MTEKQPKPRLIAYFSPHKWDHSAQVGDWQSDMYKLEILRVDPSDGKPRNCSDNDWQAPGSAWLKDFVLTAYMKWDMNKRTWEVSIFQPEYRGYMILDQRNIETMLKGIKRAEKASASLPIRPSTFGQYVALMCAALGVKECGRQKGESRSSWYTEGEYEYRPIAQIQQWLDQDIERLHETFTGEEAAA